MKKILIISGTIVVAVIIALMVMFFSSLGNGENGDRQGMNLFDAIFPFGSAPDTGSGPIVGSQEEDIDQRPVPRLRLISERPTSGGAPFADAERTLIRFMDRETGHLYETYADTRTVTRVSNTTIPGVQEVLWINQSEAIIRSLSGREVENFYIRVSGATTTTQTVTGTFMGTWVRGSLSTNGQTLATVWDEESGITLRTSNASGGSEQTLYTSPIRSLVPIRTNTSTFIQTAPAANIEGFLYRVANGNLIPTLRDVGLFALPSPNGRFVLFSSGGTNFSSLNMFDTETGEETPLPFTGVASKCIWTQDSARVLCGIPRFLPAGEYPDAWLFGRVSFSDALWSIDPLSGETLRLADFEEEYQTSIDLWQPSIDGEGEVITFINKNDLSFWSFQVEVE